MDASFETPEVGTSVFANDWPCGLPAAIPINYAAPGSADEFPAVALTHDLRCCRIVQCFECWGGIIVFDLAFKAEPLSYTQL